MHLPQLAVSTLVDIVPRLLLSGLRLTCCWLSVMFITFPPTKVMLPHLEQLRESPRTAFA